MKFDAKYYDDIWTNGVHRHDYCESLADQLIAKYHPKSLLDIGTGCGELVRVLREKGVDAWGLEVSEYAVANSHGYTIKGDVRDIPLKDRIFDVIHSQGLWEYIPEQDISKAWSECLRVGRAQEHNIDTISDTADWSKDFATYKSAEWWQDKLNIRLNLGCGNYHLEGFINIDLNCSEALKYDLRQPLIYADNSVDEIYASHIIEHFSRYEWERISIDWYRVLKSGGKLTIGCPEFEKCLRKWLDERNNDYWLKTIYGSQENKLDFHKNGFTRDSLTNELAKLGFENFEIVEDSPQNLEVVCQKSW